MIINKIKYRVKECFSYLPIKTIIYDDNTYTKSHFHFILFEKYYIIQEHTLLKRKWTQHGHLHYLYKKDAEYELNELRKLQLI